MPGRLLQHFDGSGRNIARECSSSGSEHDPDMASSIWLAEMVNDFLEEECHLESGGDPSPDGTDCKRQDLVEEIRALFDHQRSCCNSDDDHRQLVADVLRSTELAKGIENPQHRLRSIVATLRSKGYNAAVCKSRWTQSKGISKGNYAYIDVLLGSKNRLIVDVAFKVQFVIARPSDDYQSILCHIPDVFIGTGDHLHQFLHLISLAMKRSLKAHSLALPPWRRPDYLTAKWFSPYRRTTNPTPSSSLSRQSSFCDWKNSATDIDWPKKIDHKSPGLAKLLADAGMIQQQVACLPVTVAT